MFILFCINQFDKVHTPTFFFLVETLLLRNNLLHFDPAYESLSISDMDDIITLKCIGLIGLRVLFIFSYCYHKHFCLPVLYEF